MSLLLLLACDGAPDTALVASDEDIVALRIEPAELVAYTSPGEPFEVQFTAWAERPDGSEVAFELVQWSSSNESAGGIDSEGYFASVDTNGGVTEISARSLTHEMTARVQIIYTEDIVPEGIDEGLAEAFNAVESFNGGGPEILYPGDGVRVPRNLEGLAFTWADAQGHDAYRVRFRSDITDISIYTDSDIVTVGADLWELISAANRDGEVYVVVQSGTWDGTTLGSARTGDPITLTVNRLDARGSVLYWAADQAGIMRIPLGSDQAELFWRGKTGEQCVGCHVVSSLTNRMVVNHDGVNGVFAVVDVSDPDAPHEQVGPNDEKRVSFKALTPDGTQFVASNFGVLSLWQVQDGGQLKTFDTGGRIYTHLDFHPDGDRLVAVEMEKQNGQQNEFFFQKGRIVVIPYDQATQELGSPQVVVDWSGNINNYYPAWSPTGEWIAYNRAVGQAYANSKAALWLTNEDGSINIELVTANAGSNNQNSYPRWGPLPDDNVLWLAFSSSRVYKPSGGARVPNIWVSAIDEDLASQGVDPSSEAWWLPGQVRQSDNHLPVWWEQ